MAGVAVSRPWTKAEEHRLCQSVADGVPLEALAARHNRSVDSIRLRCASLGIAKPRRAERLYPPPEDVPLSPQEIAIRIAQIRRGL